MPFSSTVYSNQNRKNKEKQLISNSAKRREHTNDDDAKDKTNDNIKSISSDIMEDAFQRVSANLVASVWGAEAHGSLKKSLDGNEEVLSFTRSATSAFEKFNENDKNKTSKFEENQLTPGSSSDESYSRTEKIAKANYADHGAHSNQYHKNKLKLTKANSNSSTKPPLKTTDPLLKRCTFSLRQLYNQIAVEHEKQAKEMRQIKAEADIQDSGTLVSSSLKGKKNKKRQQQNSQQLQPNNDCQQTKTQIDPSLTQIFSSTNADSNIGIFSKEPQQQQRQCLTYPSEPTHNRGFDNVEGNLIIHVNDIITIPQDIVQYHQGGGISSSSKRRSANQQYHFLVLDLLGQGTFAQVFKCRNLTTNEIVAFKIVKNKPAYTRQAEMEIHIFRALVSSSPSTASHSGPKKKSENMVNLLCYFTYRNHLCLVFELLGWNLYEVLKKRQFRGLPLYYVRSFLQQALDAVKTLCLKSIVHCDLKPENILLVDDDWNDVIINAGDCVIGKNASPTSYSSVGEESDCSSSVDDASSDINVGKLNSNDGVYSANMSGIYSSRKDTPSVVTHNTISPSLNESTSYAKSTNTMPKIKLIDFGSACFEGQTEHTYIQSRFYRSPEVLIGLPYDSSIDMWSLGCVAAELFLGLPILPGVHEHDQLFRITEMIGVLPDWMIEQGTKSKKFYNKSLSKTNQSGKSVKAAQKEKSKFSNNSFSIKSYQEYLASLSREEKKSNYKKYDNVTTTSRYFKRTKLDDIVFLHGQYSHVGNSEDTKKLLKLFVHFLQGVLDPDPWTRLTAYQALSHPFITGNTSLLNSTGSGDKDYTLHWQPPWDPTICRRRLLNVQKNREKQQSRRSKLSSEMGGKASFHQQHSQSDLSSSFVGADANSFLHPSVGNSVASMNYNHLLYMNDNAETNSPMYQQQIQALNRGKPVSPEYPSTSRVTAMTDAMSLSQGGIPLNAVQLSNGATKSNVVSSDINTSSPPVAIGGSVKTLNKGSSNGTIGQNRIRSNFITQQQQQLNVVQSLTPNMYPSNASTVYHAHPHGTDISSGVPHLSPATATTAAFLMSPPVSRVVSHFHSPHHHYALSYGGTGVPTLPQSYSGAYSTSQHLPMEAELAYALQRPGVMPGTINEPQQQQSPRNNSGGRPKKMSSSGSLGSQSTRGNNEFLSRQQVNSANQDMQKEESSATSASATRSLLAQQLAEHTSSSSIPDVTSIHYQQQQIHQQQHHHYLNHLASSSKPTLHGSYHQHQMFQHNFGPSSFGTVMGNGNPLIARNGYYQASSAGVTPVLFPTIDSTNHYLNHQASASPGGSYQTFLSSQYANQLLYLQQQQLTASTQQPPTFLSSSGSNLPAARARSSVDGLNHNQYYYTIPPSSSSRNNSSATMKSNK